jgi:hypothetical protein
MDPIYLGHKQCFNPTNQCYSGEDEESKLKADKILSEAFSDACRNNNPENVEMRCCPLELMNRPYIPSVSRMPIHVKKVGDQYQMCPETVQSQCFREEGENFVLCVAQKCNDARYLEAENYYQICKAFKNQQGETVPDCPKKKCEKMMTLPSWYVNKMKSPQQQQDQSVIAPGGPMFIPPQRIYTEKKKKQEKKPDYLTLRGLFDKFPKQQSFYTWGSLILGFIAVIIFVTIWFVSKPRTATINSF